MRKDRITRRARVIAAGLLGVLVAWGAVSQAEAAFDAKKEVEQPGWKMEFAQINPMIKMAPAYGDRAKTAHGTFGVFAPNFITPSHTHTGAYHGVVIEGVMTNPFKGEKNPAIMGPGSYWYVPAKMPHKTACISNTPCKFYFHAAGPFDFIPVKKK